MLVSVYVIVFYRIFIWKLLKDVNKFVIFDEYKKIILSVIIFYFLFGVFL